MNLYNLDSLENLTTLPTDPGRYEAWIRQDDIIPFLEKEAEEDYIILFGSFSFGYIEALLIPDETLDAQQRESLKDWQPILSHAWGIVSDAQQVWIEPSLERARIEIIRRGEQLFYMRSFEGDSELRHYYELPQKLTHILNIHYLPERKAWCRLYHLGDIFEVVKLIKWGERNTAIVMHRDTLSEYAGLTDTQLLRLFDFTRLDLDNFGMWKGQVVGPLPEHPFIFGRKGTMEGHASYSRGVQVVPLALDSQELNRRHGWNSYRNGQRYTSFIAMDWKNRRIAECSCDPAKLDSYFEDTGQPFETTPAFFRPEVLLKYKADEEKYSFVHGGITCRGSWSLRSYEINEAGQLHAYLIDLSHLPYEEQLYWRGFNEKPKTGISKRALARDFEGKWAGDDDPLSRLSRKLSYLEKNEVGWWQAKGESAIDKVNYPVTLSEKEWADELLKLDQVLVEGLSQKWLKQKALSLGQSISPQHRSLKYLESCLVGLGFEVDHAYELLSPLHELHNLRNKVKGHVQGEEAKLLIRKAKKEHGSLKQHFRSLVKFIDKSFAVFIEAFDGDSGFA